MVDDARAYPPYKATTRIILGMYELLFFEPVTLGELWIFAKSKKYFAYKF
ncbi:hypothetical protein GBAG_3583 [Buttiauxella agrestis ATCC 33320]|uniref:Uncharacterized protein n=1 Tax=Buttiauxella agrestis ATCC 33320 TaxID=1006004 RepID=A0A085G278_9ENTR|nr:hypothetical protein GBAG_3583 [Buttiauxella agrestis ATCC 33320]